MSYKLQIVSFSKVGSVFFTQFGKNNFKTKAEQTISHNEKKSPVQFKNFHTVDPAVLDLEAEGCTDHMEALNAGSSGVDYQHITLWIAHNFQNM